jgi:exonuclease SbcC
MRIHYARAEGLIGVPSFEFDFDTLPDQAVTVALVADNGIGKSTLLGSMFAAVHLDMPDRSGNLADQFRGAGEIELLWSYGLDRFRSLVKVERRNKEAYLYLNGSAEPLNKGGGVTAYAAEIRERFLTPEESKATWFGAQTKAGAFATLEKKEKRTFIVRSLALTRLALMEKVAKARAAEVAKEIETLTDRLVGIRKQQEALPALRERVPAAVAIVERSEAGVERIRTSIKTLDAEDSQLKAELGTVAAAADKMQDRLQAAGAKATRAAELAGAIGDQQDLAAQLEDLRKAKLEADEIEASISLARKDLAGWEAVVAGLADKKLEAESLSRQVVESERRRDAVQAAADRSRQEDIAERRAAIVELERQLTTCKGEAKATLVEVQTLQAKKAEIELSAKVLERVKFGQECSPCEFLTQTMASKATLPELDLKIAAAEAQGKALQERQGALSMQLLELEEALTEFKKTAVDVPEVDKEAAIIGDLKDKLEAYGVVEGQIRDGSAQVVAHRNLIAQKDIALTAARAKSERLSLAEAASGRVAELEKDLAVVREEQHAIEVEISSLALELGQTEKLNKRTTEIRTARDAASALLKVQEVEAHDNREALGKLKGQIETLEALTPQAEEADRDLAAAFDKKAVAEHLVRAFGPEGVPALKIDAAGPEVTSIANDYLASCWGPRWSIQFETQRELKSRGGTSEEFDIRVLDSLKGPALFEMKSGGERVITGESLALALSTFKSLRSGRRVETLIRDEADGALTPERALQYLVMLRRAAVRSQLHRLIFVTQRTEIWEQADARLFLSADGSIVVA